MSDDEQAIVTGDGTWTHQALRHRVSILAPGIVMIRDVPKATAESWLFQAKAAQELGDQFDAYVLVLDLAEAAGRPRGEHKEMITYTYNEILQPIHIAVVQPGSAILRTVLRFVLAPIPHDASVYATLEEALAAARDILKKHQAQSG
jgi:hypothetical protein